MRNKVMLQKINKCDKIVPESVTFSHWLNCYRKREKDLAKKKWRNKNGIYLRQWMEVIHEIDELNSLANIPFEHSEWVYPQICGT